MTAAYAHELPRYGAKVGLTNYAAGALLSVVNYCAFLLLFLFVAFLIIMRPALSKTTHLSPPPRAGVRAQAHIPLLCVKVVTPRSCLRTSFTPHDFAPIL
eukprot:TRINITY_DN6832_c0_g1_i1.p2 TRINITY_DN6832_c0_g1~~TRINITY_DN6832_c0_g1_i1.p2  ORF type:complete len:100 (-),score=9.80 TRINITY_DN6832_c0_g1_i1:130-429(-)